MSLLSIDQQSSHASYMRKDPASRATWEIRTTWDLRTATVHRLKHENKTTPEFRTVSAHNPLGFPNKISLNRLANLRAYTCFYRSYLHRHTCNSQYRIVCAIYYSTQGASYMYTMCFIAMELKAPKGCFICFAFHHNVFHCNRSNTTCSKP